MKLEEIVRQKIREVLENDNIENISANDDLKEYGIDSLNAIELVVELEMTFKIEFSEDELLLDNLCSIQKLINIVESHISEKM